MATVAAPDVSSVQKERAFFFYMALAIAATVVAGFGLFLAIGASSFGSPWWVHVHAVSMVIWVGLYLMQNRLVYRGQVGSHRRLGRIAAGWAVWVVFLGFAVTAMDVHTHRVPPFFTLNFFLAMDWLNAIAFAGLIWAAVALRHRPDWHKRLMLGAMLNLIAPAWGRLILPFLFDQRGVWLIMLALLSYFGVAMMFDRKTRGSIHPAYFWGAGTLVCWTVLTFATANLAPVMGLSNALAG